MPRDNESLIDIERVVRRVLRYASGSDRAELETNDEKASAILYQIANKLRELLILLQPLLPSPEN